MTFYSGIANVPPFDLRLHHTWTAKQMHQWVDEFGPWMFHGGHRYFIKHKLIVPGRYDVWFEVETIQA